ncbi:hypothetical protein J5N97_027332 [Dioscorea zingiberensis]|uniref:Uncharacterized protein n=1 Tax=Dioscorea zingiberensis TaxID=325984 RepID=A0A9D5C532_9LILI|nr:hypothetical protein J5N97_027332 [Dioscorea zingiberensis]
MRTTAVTDSKPSKKTSSEDRSRKRKIKSAKRRRDSSSEASSYSSSEDEPRRSRRKISRREHKRGLRSPSPRKRKEVKKPEKKKSRKARYSRNVSVSSSGSGSSRSCSTCRSRSISRSRSPARADRKGRGRGRQREKGGKSSQKSRYSSPNCSTCSGGYSTRSSNSSDRGRERNRKRENSRRPKLVSRNRENKERSRDEDKAKIIKAYGDYPSDVGRKKETYEHGPETKRTVEEVEDMQENTQSDRVEEFTLSKGKEEPVKHGDDGGKKPSGAVEDSNSSKVDDLELVLRLKALENFNKYRVGLFASSKVGDGKDESGHTEYLKDAGKVSETKLSSQMVITTASMERKPVKSLEHQTLDEAERQNSEVRIKSAVSRPTEVRIKSVVTIPPQVSDVVKSTEENNDNLGSKSIVLDEDIIPSYYGEDQNSPSQLKSVNELANTLSPAQNSFAKDDQSKRTAGELRGNLLLEAEGNKTDVCAAGASSGPKTGSANVREATQFEQKTFSRMHDGEVVQVSYKVYIPKKTPALARRQLRR